jgi:hypothetical protein
MTLLSILEARWRAQALHPENRLKSTDLAGLLRAVGGLQAQDAAAAVLGARARSAGLTAGAVEAARVEARTIVRTWAMRGTLHLLAVDEAAWLTPLLGPRFVRGQRGRRAQLGLDDAATEKGVQVIREALAGQGPLGREALRAALKRRGVSSEGQATIHLIGCAAAAGLVVYGPGAGKEMLFALVDDWAPAARPASLPDDKALAELARRFLGAFGPAGPEDLALWAGIGLGEARQGFAAIAGELHEARWDFGPVWLPRERAAWLKARRGPAPIVRLLPRFDNYLIAYANRDPYLDPAHARQVMAGGLIRSSLAVDGVVRGLWELKRARRSASVAVKPFAPLRPAEARGVEAEAEDVRRFLEP